METLYIFDIDGVLTNPDIKIPNSEVLHFMAEELNKGWHAAIATGRSSTWVQEHIIPLIVKKLRTKKLLDNLFISCEKGAVTITFTNSIPHLEIDQRFCIPQEIQEIIKKAINGMHGIFFDPDKKTMVSVEITGGHDTKKVNEEKDMLYVLETWVQEHVIPEFPDVQMEKTEISMDIQHKHIDKRIASEKLLKFLKKRHVSPSAFVAFGDSPSDASIAEKIAQEKQKATFVYVGKKPLLRQYNFPIIRPHDGAYFDAAVVQVLQQLQES